MFARVSVSIPASTFCLKYFWPLISTSPKVPGIIPSFWSNPCGIFFLPSARPIFLSSSALANLNIQNLRGVLLWLKGSFLPVVTSGSISPPELLLGYWERTATGSPNCICFIPVRSSKLVLLVDIPVRVFNFVLNSCDSFSSTTICSPLTPVSFASFLICFLTTELISSSVPTISAFSPLISTASLFL